MIRYLKSILVDGLSWRNIDEEFLTYTSPITFLKLNIKFSQILLSLNIAVLNKHVTNLGYMYCDLYEQQKSVVVFLVINRSIITILIL